MEIMVKTDSKSPIVTRVAAMVMTELSNLRNALAKQLRSVSTSFVYTDIYRRGRGCQKI